MISVSVVSHGQGGLVSQVLSDLAKLADPTRFEVILTKNVPEELAFSIGDFPFPVRLLENDQPKGFGANHNAAFKVASGAWFCVMNPDIRFSNDPFPSLLWCLTSTKAGVAGPHVLAPDGSDEDSARRFPSPLRIVCKALGGCKGGDYAMEEGCSQLYPDWIAGMFMLFPREVFEAAGGFDTRYFLYYEDVDLCARLRLMGWQIVICTGSSVVHHARRSSHRNLKYLRLHAVSMLRFFFSPVYWRVACRNFAKDGCR